MKGSRPTSSTTATPASSLSAASTPWERRGPTGRPKSIPQIHKLMEFFKAKPAQ